MKTLTYMGTPNFNEYPVTGRVVTWTYGQTQSVDDGIATTLLAANAFFQQESTNPVVYPFTDAQTANSSIKGLAGADLNGGIYDAAGNLISAGKKTYNRGDKLLERPTSGAGTVTGTGSSIVYETLDNVPVASVITGAGQSATFTLNAFTGRYIKNGMLSLAIRVDDMAKVNNISVTLGDNASFTNSFTCLISNSSAFPFDGWYNICIAPDASGAWSDFSALATNQDRRWSVGAGSPSFDSTLFTRLKIDISSQSGQQAKVSFADVTVGQRNSKATLSLTFDDGNIEMYTQIAPLLESYGFRGSMGIIGSLIGPTAGSNMSLAQLQDLVARGHEAVVHGNFSLATFPDIPTKQADVALNQNFLLQNGLNVNDSAYVYIYPFTAQVDGSGATIDDTQIKTVLTNLGFIGARGAGFVPVVFNQYNRMQTIPYVPEIAHRANTTSDALETANVDRVVKRINQMGVQGRNGCLTIHKTIPSTAGVTQASNIEIQVQNFIRILDAIKAEVDAGRLEVMLLSSQIKYLKTVAQLN